jgi:N-acetylneuraminic acid mutarotase
MPRWSHSAAVVDGKIYVMGGWGADSNRPVAAVEVYDPATGAWAAGASMPTARALFGVSTVGGRIYAVGGTTFGADKLAVVEAYDPATDTWTRRADIPTPRNALSTVVVDEKIYAIGGWVRRAGADVALSLMEVYDTASKRWTPGADMPTPRWVPSSGVIDGRIYVAGGTTSVGPASSQVEAMGKRVPLSVVEVYDPATGRWATDADLATPRGWLSANVVNGRMFVIGGRSLAPEGEILEVMGAFPGLEIYAPTH